MQEFDEGFTGVCLAFAPGPAIPPRRVSTERGARTSRPPRQGTVAAHLRGPGDPVAGGPRPRHSHDVQGVRGRRADPAKRQPGHRAPHRSRDRRHPAGRAHLDAAALPRPHGDQAGSRHQLAFLLARRHPADELLRPAFRRRHRQSGRVERQGRPGDLQRARLQRDQRSHHGDLRGRHALLRSAADAGRGRHGHRQPGGAAAGFPRPGGREPPSAQGAGQGGRHLRQRHPHDGDAEGERNRGRLLLALVRHPRQRPRRPAAARASHEHPERRPAVAFLADHRRHSRRRRLAGSSTGRSPSGGWSPSRASPGASPSRSRGSSSSPPAFRRSGPTSPGSTTC